MESVDQQFRQLKENYEHMTEDELGALAEKGYNLTDIAREVLQAVITERGFTVRLKLEPPAPLRAKPPEDDEGLINFKWPDKCRGRVGLDENFNCGWDSFFPWAEQSHASGRIPGQV